MAGQISAAKAELRRSLKAQRRSLSAAERHAAAIAAAHHALGLLGSHSVFALYSDLAEELSTLPLEDQLRKRGGEIYFPRVGAERTISFHRAEDAGRTDLVPGPRGVLEPPRDRPSLPPSTEVAFIVPGIGFARDGRRLGYGHGYYNRVLARFPRCLRIGYAFQCQIVETLPEAPHDQRMDWIVTQTGSHSCPPR